MAEGLFRQALYSISPKGTRRKGWDAGLPEMAPARLGWGLETQECLKGGLPVGYTLKPISYRALWSSRLRPSKTKAGFSMVA